MAANFDDSEKFLAHAAKHVSPVAPNSYKDVRFREGEYLQLIAQAEALQEEYLSTPVSERSEETGHRIIALFNRIPDGALCPTCALPTFTNGYMPTSDCTWIEYPGPHMCPHCGARFTADVVDVVVHEDDEGSPTESEPVVRFKLLPPAANE